MNTEGRKHEDSYTSEERKVKVTFQIDLSGTLSIHIQTPIGNYYHPFQRAILADHQHLKTMLRPPAQIELGTNN